MHDTALIRGMVNGIITAWVGLLFIKFVWPGKEKLSTWKFILLIVVLAIFIGLILGLIEKLMLS